MSDRGRGIAPDLLPLIFDLFVQGGDAAHRIEGGLGIGLTLGRQLVALYGGTVEARSDGEGKGSEFVVRLPRAVPHGRDDELAVARGAHGGKRSVLLVEDDEDVGATLGALLEGDGHRVTVVGDGASAIERLAGRAGCAPSSSGGEWLPGPARAPIVGRDASRTGRSSIAAATVPRGASGGWQL